ncbi:MAG TPA: hypothetical protein VFN41_06440 [Candidatus Limnocylindrales bacterium]|nr:hypothetical protein [Candidatus Limnocylindrales bacterium]
MGIGATAVAALLAVLERPVTWLLALVGFLVRGGSLVVLAPIVVLPTAVGLANVVAPLVEDIAFGRRTDEVITAGLMTLVVGLVWLIGGGLLAAAAEVEGVRRTIEGLGDPPPRDALPHPVWRVLAVRSVTLVPLAIALAWSGFRLVSVGYRELTVPSDVATPISFRILVGAPDAILAIVLTWLFAEIAGGLAARRIVLDGANVRTAVRTSLRDLRRDGGRLVVLALLSAVVLVATTAVTGIATGTVWDGLRAALADRDLTFGAVARLVLFVGLFAASLVILGLTTAWRSAVWTVVVARDGGPAAGTFGGGTGTRSGD